MFKNYFTFLLKVFFFINVVCLSIYGVLSQFSDNFNFIDEVPKVLSIALSMTAFTAATSLNLYVLSFFKKGIYIGILRKKVLWREVTSLKLTSFFGYNWSKIITISTADNEFNINLVAVGDQEAFFSKLKSELHWVPSDTKVSDLSAFEFKR